MRAANYAATRYMDHVMGVLGMDTWVCTAEAAYLQRRI